MKYLPKINLFYWALIISANTMGETAGDLISQTFNLGYGGGTLVLLAMLIIAVTLSIFSKSQNPILYWTLITLSSTAGTTISDYLSRTLGFGYFLGTLFLVIVLCITFIIWKWHSKSDALNNGLNKTTEFLYWTAMLSSSTLGTAFGDLLAHNTPLGFDFGTLFLLVLLMIVTALDFYSKLSKTLIYWLAIILTHPIGATIGDYMTKTEGLNFGNSKASLILVVVFILVVLVRKFTIQKP